MYRNFAKYYDHLITDLSYSDRAVYFKKVIDTFLPETTLLLDMGCGTGSLCVELANLGYDVTGVDVSPEMLSEAVAKTSQTEHNILYLCQDMREIDLYGTMDTVLCTLDTLNHITEEADLDKTFAKLSNFVADDGLFIFDINTIYKHMHVLSNNTFVFENEEVYCVWQNAYEEESEIVEISLDFFEYEDGVYHRSSEEFCERAYSTELLTALLNKNNFTVKAIYDEDSFNPPHSESERLVFVAKREKRNNNG